jgi:hypothetical protein
MVQPMSCAMDTWSYTPIVHVGFRGRGGFSPETGFRGGGEFP